MTWRFRPSSAADAAWMAELRAEVLRTDLERVGVFDEQRVRTRFLDAFVPAHTRVVVADGQDAGLVAVRPEDGALWIEHFYLSPRFQGRGLGGEVLARILREESGRAEAFRLNVLQGSAARRLYDRHGFLPYAEDAVDVFMEREAKTPERASGACTTP